jgi:sialate O-acetylesterase
MPDFQPAVAQFQQLVAASESGTDQYENQLAKWWRDNDPGSADARGWADPALNAADWKTMKLPTQWEQAGLPEFDGVVWFRKAFDLPASAANKDGIRKKGKEERKRRQVTRTPKTSARSAHETSPAPN